MKKRIKIVLLLSLAIVVIAIGICTVYLASTNQTIMVGRCLLATNGKYLIINENGNPIVMGNEREDLFDDLQSGDKILMVCGVTLTSYPGETAVTKCWLIGAGSITDIPNAALSELRSMGWQFK